jgi:hypothetical protein
MRSYIDYQIDGLRVRKAVKAARTRTDALKVLNAEVSDAFREKHGFKKDVPVLSFREMGDLYMEHYSKPKKKSWETSDRVFLGSLGRAFGDFKLGNLRPEMVEDYMTKRLADGLKPCSVNREVSCLRTIYNVAISWGYVSENPVKKVKLFSEKKNIRTSGIRSPAAEKKRAVELLCGKALEPVQECQTGLKSNAILVDPSLLTRSFSDN